MDNIHITQNGVLKLLSSLSIHKAAGPDEIHTKLFKELVPYLAETFTTYFQAYINQGTIQPDWKGDKSRVSNYRSVSRIVVTCKILEHIICSSVAKHLETYGILNDDQHGFRKNRFCESQPILTIQDLAKGIDLGEQIDLILLDFFDGI